MNEYQPPAVKQSNGMGLAGFIVSLLGVISCGLLGPVGLILSIIGMRKEPRGFAIAGLVLGIIGSLWIVFILFFGGLAIVMTALGLGAALAVAGIVAAVGQNAISIVDAVHDHHEANGVIPATLDELNIAASERTDTWGNDFIYVPSGNEATFLLISAGPDGIPGNNDDLIGEVSFEDSDFDAELHRGYGDINRSEWPNLPAAPQPNTPPAEPEQ